MKNFVVSIAGIIGAGKSSVANELASRGWQVFQEPFQQNPLLEVFYEDMNRFAVITQMEFLHLREDQFFAVRSYPGPVIMERSIADDRWVFGETLKDSGFGVKQEWEAYERRYDTWTRRYNLIPDLCIFLDEAPDVALERIRLRARRMEEGITLEYLQTLREKHIKNALRLGRQVVACTGSDGLNWPGAMVSCVDFEGLPSSITGRADAIETIIKHEQEVEA